MASNLNPGEQVVFEGHPSWRAILAFYLKGITITIVIVVILSLIGASTGLVVGALLVGSGLTVLAEEAIAVKDLSAERLAQQIRNAEEDVADATDPEKKRKAQEMLDHLKDMKSVL